MEAYIPFLYSEDIDDEIYFREAALEAKKFDHEISVINQIYLEADEDTEKPGLFSTMASKIKSFIDRIIETIRDFLESIGTTFGSKMNSDDYLSSDTVEVKLNEDIEKITSDIEAEILSERKGVQAISKFVQKIGSVTGFPIDQIIDDKTIGNAVDKANAFVVKYGGTAIKAGAATLIASKLYGAISDSSGLAKELKESEEKIERKRNEIEKNKLRAYEQNGNKIFAKIQKLSMAIDATSKRAMKYYAKITKPLNKFKKNFNKMKK